MPLAKTLARHRIENDILPLESAEMQLLIKPRLTMIWKAGKIHTEM
jgi:hypothetical protein